MKGKVWIPFYIYIGTFSEKFHFSQKLSYNDCVQILIARYSGFCEGVERAYQIALEQTKTGQPVFMLGNLVHNTQVIEKLKSLNVKTVKSVAEIPAGSKGTLLISAHGVSPQVYEEAKGLGLGIIDTTCAWVKKAQRIAEESNEEDRTVIIVGDKGHAEVKGLVGWAGGRAQVIENIKDMDKIGGGKVSVIAQTTQAEEHFKKIVAAIRNKTKDVKEFNTICGATSKRQNAAVELAKKVDLILVIGDKMSANTKRLSELCSQTGTATHQIQTVAELDSTWLKGKTKIGLTAGASTPDWVVQEVVAKLGPAQKEKKCWFKALAIIILLCALLGRAQASVLQHVRYGDYKDKLRAVFDFDGSFGYETEGTKDKIVISLKDVDAAANIENYIELNDLVVRHFEIQKETNGLKVTIPLLASIEYTVFPLDNPPRLVVDFGREFLNIVSEGTVADGVELLSAKKGLAAGQINASILKVDLNKVEVKPALAKKTKPNIFQSFIDIITPWRQGTISRDFFLDKVVNIVNDHNAVAGINGTYFAPDGQPLGSLMIDQELVSFPIYDRTAFFLDQENQPYIDNISITSSFKLASGIRYTISGINQSRGSSDSIMYTPVWGETTKTNTQGLEIVVKKEKIVGINVSNSIIPDDGYVLSINGPGVETLAENVKVGDNINTSIRVIPYSTSPQSIINLISGGPRLIKKGRVYISKYQEQFKSDIAKGRAARTALGITKNRDLLLITVDGLPKKNKNTKENIGVTLEELSNLLLSLGAVEAMNLDGGSSATMVVNGRTINKPTAGFQRRISNALILKRL
ncbi:4-hydroxy-3-methylbut-2-enyl diphosphate reductase [candidate division WOR-1 bacterium RIFCSPLOWO2_02_FULL_46_20]|uniref:4-hydroxy-3-methylbut-2-enyl diphosphate reductase n=1 Tax=candidate division WOR-1 bacterium RIFCSPLOWO2_02_FULL_46_20 TaxID=1802567 RepID=A0A1F4RCU8_UNCSA|nr:MAG: 4-hydroxy-3-methylbut-2-enyl diphosphate reductase [candidate division WOR-1 bacterium RIFCSPHIGHO2_02_FULL_45_12]OGC05997.1 MAG: 4-hydroxy-3-methylbut-2-enyl diphosphate reductase [candidate division WOR-1 bacterium RIFCSPLOWO2_02_FULL_46_20]